MCWIMDNRQTGQHSVAFLHSLTWLYLCYHTLKPSTCIAHSSAGSKYGISGLINPLYAIVQFSTFPYTLGFKLEEFASFVQMTLTCSEIKVLFLIYRLS